MTVVEAFQWCIFIASVALFLLWSWFFIKVIFRFTVLILLLWIFLFALNWLSIFPEPYNSKLQSFLSHNTVIEGKAFVRKWAEEPEKALPKNQ
jgi:hypothetical protein